MKTNDQYLKIIATAAAIGVFVLLFTLLIRGVDVFTPIAWAVVFWYIIITLISLFQRIDFGDGKRMPHFLALLLALLTCFAAVWLFISIITQNVVELSQEIPVYQTKLTAMLQQVLNYFGTSGEFILDSLNQIDFGIVLSSILSGIGSLINLSSVIIVYLIFLLWEYRTFDTKLANLVPDPARLARARATIKQINSSARSYITIQSLVSILTGVLTTLVLWAFDIKFAAFWGLLAFILNFIPFIGSIIATVLPTLFVLVDTSSWQTTIILLFLIGLIQFSIGNVLAPKLMGKGLNLSPLVILIGLFVWGAVWGFTGAFLSVPFMVIITIVLSQFEATRWISVLLSDASCLPPAPKTK